MSHESSDERLATPEAVSIPPGHAWNRIPTVGVVLGLLGTLASLALAAKDPRQFYFSWLVAFAFFLSIAIGALFFVLMHHAAKAGWSVAVRRIAENAMGTLPLFVPLFVPVLIGMADLFPWAGTDAATRAAALGGRGAYLNPGFFTARAAVYLACWTAMGVYFLRASRRQDRTGEHAITRRLQSASGPAIVAAALTTTFAAVDWLMTLAPGWYSTMYGVYFFSGSLVAVYAFVAVVGAAMRRAGLVRDALNVEHFHDLGKLLFAFTVFWAYIAFSQYFLIWYGNIPEETVWYARRMHGSWQGASIALAVGHFGVPFLFLLPRATKRATGPLVAGAIWMLAMHLLDLHWLIMPALHPEGIRPAPLDATCLVAVGGFFTAVFGWATRRHALIPVRDPRLKESLSFESA